MIAELKKILSDLIIRGWDDCTIKDFIVKVHNYQWDGSSENLLRQLRMDLKNLGYNEV